MAGTKGEIARRTYLGDHASYAVRVGALILRITAPKTVESEPGTLVRVVVRHATALPVVKGEENGTTGMPDASDMTDAARGILKAVP